jgi:uncharacterized OB-fold protein
MTQDNPHNEMPKDTVEVLQDEFDRKFLKYHDYKNVRDSYYRKHRCKKCGEVYLAPNSSFLNSI